MKKKVLALLCALVLIFSMIPAAAAADTTPTVTVDGATIRTEGKQGLRFKITVTNASQATDYGIILNYAGKTKRIGTDTNYTNVYSRNEAKDTLEYTVVLINIPVDNFETDVSANGYVTYEGGSTTTDAITRNTQGVANAAGMELNADGSLTEMGGTELTLQSWGSGSVADVSTLAGKTVNISMKVRVAEMGYDASVDSLLLQTNDSSYTTVKSVTATNAWTTVSVSNFIIPEGAKQLYFGGVSSIVDANGKLYVKDVVVEKADLSGDVSVDLSTAATGYGTSIANNADGSITISLTSGYGQMGFALGALKLEDYSSVQIVYEKTGSDSQFQFKITDGAGAYETATKTTYPGYNVAAGEKKTEVIDISDWERTGATYLLIGGNGDTNLQLTVYSITLQK